MKVGYFGAIVNSDTFIEKLKQSSKVELTFTKPKSLLKILDIQSDSFKTKGLNSSYSLLDNSCPNWENFNSHFFSLNTFCYNIVIDKYRVMKDKER